MNYGLYAAVSGGMVQEKRMELLSNNLANVNTAGFKEDRPLFKELPIKFHHSMEFDQTSSLQRLLVEQKMVNVGYLAFAGIKTDFSTGEIKYTGNPLDVAISGSGFFVVSTPQGECYTRMGTFSRNEKGELVTGEGYPLKGKEKTVEIRGEEVVIDKEGNITVDGEPVDRLKIVDFEDYTGLRKIGDNLFENIMSNNEKKAGKYELHQRSIELSNINIVDEMVKMIDVLRLYESYQKVIQSFDETTGKATREVGVVV